MSEKKAKLPDIAKCLNPKQNAATHPDDNLSRQATIASALIQQNEEKEDGP